MLSPTSYPTVGLYTHHCALRSRFCHRSPTTGTSPRATRLPCSPCPRTCPAQKTTHDGRCTNAPELRRLRLTATRRPRCASVGRCHLSARSNRPDGRGAGSGVARETLPLESEQNVHSPAPKPRPRRTTRWAHPTAPAANGSLTRLSAPSNWCRHRLRL